MAVVLCETRTRECDGAAIQEPWRNPVVATTRYPEKNIFDLCCSAAEEAVLSKVCVFVEMRSDRNEWQYKEYSRGICSLTSGFSGHL
jgi:hypothetical protein